MLGAIVGDIAGSRFEFKNHKTSDIDDFELFSERSKFTDDTVMTLAVARAVLACRDDLAALPGATVESMRALGRAFPKSGYGPAFWVWLNKAEPKPYNSFGNGAGMRVSSCGWAARSVDEAKELSRLVTGVTHDHPEGLKGAEAIAAGIRVILSGGTQDELRAFWSRGYYPLDFILDSIRDEYKFDMTCQGSVPQALTAFLEAKDFIGAVRLAISIGGDSDTIAAMTGSLAEARWGIPQEVRNAVLGFLPKSLRLIVEEFEAAYPPKLAAE